MAKKHNKSKQQKPNYSKRGITNFNAEAGADLDLEQNLKDNTCVSTDNSICKQTPKKK